ncbi:MAG: SRPBCC domain-containing protein [Polyangiaceae bacterium]|nr:SRPBCC domain-containing protein [Polyangiaceae bacterium]
MALRYDTEIEIQASPEIVWGLLNDPAKWPEWNSILVSLEGTPSVGAQVQLAIHVAGCLTKAKVKILEYEANAAMGWQGGLPGLIAGKHGFRIEKLSNGTVSFVHYEHFSGLLVPLLGKALSRIEPDYHRFNQELKTAAETVAN